MDQRRLSSGFLPQLLRYSFCEICRNKQEGLSLKTQGQKSLFPHWPALHHLFCYHLYWCGDAWKEHLSFMFVPVLLCSGLYSGLCTQVTNASPGSLSSGGILEGYPDRTPGGIRGKQGLMVKNWTSVWDASGLPLVHLHPISVVEPGGTRTGPASARDKVQPGKESFGVKSVYTPIRSREGRRLQ